MDAFPSLNCSSSVANHQEEEDEDWVVVKKQKIIILIPPTSPPSQQIAKIAKELSPKSTNQPKSAKISSNISKEKSSEHKKIGHKPLVFGSDRFDQKPRQRQRPEPSVRPHAVGKVGAVKLANRQMRAMNLERKLRILGGIRRWLSLLGLDRFADLFERKNVGRYQLVNLSTTKLKDLGMNAVGPRRKLMHAIDLLCQPYYRQGF